MVPPKPNPLREPDFSKVERNIIEIKADGSLTQSMLFGTAVLIVIMFGMMSVTIAKINSLKTDIDNLERIVKGEERKQHVD